MQSAQVAVPTSSGRRLSKYLGEKVECYGFVRRFGANNDGHRTVLIEGLRMVGTHERLADHVWIRTNRRLEVAAPSAGQWLSFTGLVEKYTRFEGEDGYSLAHLRSVKVLPGCPRKLVG